MSLSLPTPPVHRARAVVLAGTLVAVAAAGVPFLASGASAASSASTPAAGTIHVYMENTSLSPTAPSKILITGAFSDHGPGKHGVWHLTKGTITVNNATLRAITSSPGFRTFYPASCSYSHPLASGHHQQAASKRADRSTSHPRRLAQTPLRTVPGRLAPRHKSPHFKSAPPLRQPT